MFLSQISPTNLLDQEIVNKFWLLRGQGLYWVDSLFIDGVTFLAILVYFMGIMRFSRSLQWVFLALEQNISALARWFIVLCCIAFCLTVSNLTIQHLRRSE